jgi:hypothetical protein
MVVKWVDKGVDFGTVTHVKDHAFSAALAPSRVFYFKVVTRAGCRLYRKKKCPVRLVGKSTSE